MSAQSSIEWTDRTWNPVRGCSVISPGCVNCYAMKQAHRFSGRGRAYEGLTKLTKAGPQWTGVIRTVDSALLEPLSWRKPQRVFVNSMSDLFHEDVPDAFIDQVFATMAAGHRHTYQILTKRAERMRVYMSDSGLEERIHWASLDRFGHTVDFDASLDSWVYGRWPLPHVWLGVSVEDRNHLHRIDTLKDTPAAVHFASMEPLLEDLGALMLDGIEWVIVGGESGPGARPLNVRWVRSIVAQCEEAAGVRTFVKQLGAQWYDPDRLRSRRGAVLIPVGAPWTFVDRGDAKGGDMSEWPEDIRVRQFPCVSPQQGAHP